MDKSRRNFLARDLWRGTIGLLKQEFSSNAGKEELSEKEDYFESFERCYPLLAEAGELLFEEARRQGIQTEGKTKLEIAKEIFSERDPKKREDY
jgi:hypothetical protein